MGKGLDLIHRIHLDNRSCIRDFKRDLSLEEENKRRASFINFVKGVLSLTGNNSILYVTSFCLEFYFSWPEHTFDQEIPYLIEWLAASITPNLQRFDFLIAVRVCRFPPIKMPPTLFECQKLVFLKIDCFYSKIIRLHLPKTVCLSSLEKLHLATVQFENENSLKNLLSGCPVLEELYMKTIERPAPKLEYLDFADHSLLGFRMSASPSLVSDVIDISIRPGYQLCISS
ncbi:hypothetical protein CRYUN_Cryun05aG0005600 [Craigia yunnanensis]